MHINISLTSENCLYKLWVLLSGTSGTWRFTKSRVDTLPIKSFVRFMLYKEIRTPTYLGKP